jgi:hypothetical protein
MAISVRNSKYERLPNLVVGSLQIGISVLRVRRASEEDQFAFDSCPVHLPPAMS